MRLVRVIGPFLVFLFSGVAAAEQPQVAVPPSSGSASREQVLEARVNELEQKLEALSARIDGSNAVSVPGVVAVDPDLARAAEQDRTTGDTAEATAPSDEAQQVVTPLAKLNPDISFILDVGLGWFSQDKHLRQGGHAIDENGFVVQALELAASAAVDPYFKFDFYFQMQHLHLEEAFLTTLSLPANLQARAGYFNAAFGRQNPQHVHSWNTVNPPLSQTRFMSEEHFSGAGAELSAILPLPWYMLILGEVMTTSSAVAFRSSTFATVEKNGNGRTDGLEDLLYVARIENFFELSTDWSLLVGLSGAFGQSPYVPDNRAALYGGDLYLKWRPLARGGDFALALTIEAVLRDTQVPGDSVRDWGGYAQIDAQLSRRFMASLRGDFTNLVRGVSPDPVKIPGRQARGSLALTFLPTHFSKIRLQTDLSQPQPGSDAVVAVFLQVEVSAGEHGAHRF